MNRLLYIVSQQLKESEETKKHLDTSSSNVQGSLPVIKDDEGEKIDWNEVLQQGVECGPASQEGETEGDEVSKVGGVNDRTAYVLLCKVFAFECV